MDAVPVDSTVPVSSHVCVDSSVLVSSHVLVGSSVPVSSHVLVAFPVWGICHHIPSLASGGVLARTNLYLSVGSYLDTGASGCGAGFNPHFQGFLWHSVGRVDVPDSLFRGLFWREVSRYLPAPGPHWVGLVLLGVGCSRSVG